MPPKKQWIDKKNATTYQLLHRSQHDPLIHDPDADDRVLHQVSDAVPPSLPQSSKHIKNLSDLQREFASKPIRENEGEAANYGILFDDTKYDYMQHLRELGTAGGNSYFVESSQKGKGKIKGMKLEDALRQTSLYDTKSELDHGHDSVYGSDIRSTVSSYIRPQTYQNQQNIPDDIAGLHPDMDPRLREVLEALEDDAFIDDEDSDDIFGQLTRETGEIEPSEWEDTLFDQEENDDGWESDVTAKAPARKTTMENVSNHWDATGNMKQEAAPGALPDDNAPIPDLQSAEQGWVREFAKYKKEIKASAARQTPSVAPSEQRTIASTAFTAGGTPIRTKKRKGALTNPSAYSMTSSSLVRTEGHKLLDDRFERIEALYALDEGDEFDDNMSMVSGMTGATSISTTSSSAPSLVDANETVSSSNNFNNIMDDFLAGWDDKTSAQTKRKGAKSKRGKNGNEAVGMRMLDDIRQGLGPARVPGKVPGRV